MHNASISLKTAKEVSIDSAGNTAALLNICVAEEFGLDWESVPIKEIPQLVLDFLNELKGRHEHLTKRQIKTIAIVNHSHQLFIGLKELYPDACTQD